MITVDDIKKVKTGLSFWLRRWYRCPLAYVIEMLGEVPTHQQAQILKAFEYHNFVAVKSGHGIGKSKLMGWLVNWWLDTRGKRAPITGSGGDQLCDIVWPEVVLTNGRKWPWLAKQYENTSEELRQTKRKEIAKAVLRTARADNDDALQGFHDCMFFIDEGSGVRDGIFEVASGAMGDPGAFGFMAGNPTRLTGYMYNVFHRPSFWYTMSFSSEDSLAEKEYSYTYVDPLGDIKVIHTHGRQTMQWVENMRKEYGINSNSYRVRVRGEFANVGADMLIEERWLDHVFLNDRVLSDKKSERKFKRRIGIDPAWTGDDDTGVVIREGDTVLHAESWHGFDLVESFERIKVLWDEWNVDVGHIDTVGVGAGLYDMFKHAVYHGNIGYPVIRVHCSEIAPEDKDGTCKSLRDWLWWKSRKYFRVRTVRFNGSETNSTWKQLRTELLTLTYKIQGGKVVAESKDDLKKRGIKSPNLADALNTTFFQDYEIFKESYTNNTELARLARRKRKPLPSWRVI